VDGLSRSSPVDRFLRLFTDVRGGESGNVLYLTLNVFLLLTAYSVLKVVREALILGGATAEVKSYTAAGQVLLLAGLVPLYGAVAARVPRRRLINWVTAFFVACLLVFYVVAQAGVSGFGLGVAFFVWVGIFNVMIIAQFWAFANDVYTTDEGKRLFPIVGFGASSGGVVGAYLPTALSGIGIYQLFILSAALLIIAALVTNIVDSRERRRTEAHIPDPFTTGTMPAATGQFRAATGEFKVPEEEYRLESGVFRAPEPEKDAPPEPVVEEPASEGSAFQLVFRSRYLLMIALLILLLNWVNTNGEYILGRTVETLTEDAVAARGGGQAEIQAGIAAFYSKFQTVVNILALLFQALLVSRVMKYAGVGRALLFLPAIALIGYTVIAVVPILGVIRWIKTAENSTDYSLNNTVRHALFLPTTREEKYKAKQVVDSFFWRAGDVLSAVVVMVGVQLLMLTARQFALVNVVLVLAWLVLAVLIGRRYDRLATATQ
jgi:AAA family ATP:ADP antiporter